LDASICRDSKYREFSAPPLYPGHHLSPVDCAPRVAIAATPAVSAATARRYLPAAALAKAGRDDRELLCAIGAVS
jgi:hypothetical protein